MLAHIKYVQNFPVMSIDEYGLCSEGAYTISGWVNGNALEKALKKSNKEKEYQLGESAGVLLKSLHDNNPSCATESNAWQREFSVFMDSKIKEYLKCGIRFEGDEAIIKYLSDNRFLLLDRPMCLIHGDLTLANIMIQREGGGLFLVDVDSIRHGDPYFDLRQLAIGECRPIFNTGFINGYTSCSPDNSLWELLRFYCCVASLHMVSKCSKKRPGQAEYALQYIEKHIATFCNSNQLYPTWYLGEANNCLKTLV